jgi:hypothetical protein
VPYRKLLVLYFIFFAAGPLLTLHGKLPAGLIEPQNTARCGRSVQVRHHRQPLDLVIRVGLQERIVVPEGHTPIGVAVRAQQVVVRK